MKRVTIFCFVILMSLSLLAQVPSGISYQTLIRNSVGLPIADTALALKIAIRSGSPDGVVVYDEIHNVFSNTFGLVTLVIGNGSPQTGSFSTISWGIAPHFLEVSLNQEGDNQWNVLGVTQFVSVPYALNSGSLNLTSPNGTTFEVKVDDEGNLTADCFPDPTQADAGPDQWIAQPGISTTLQGNIPVSGTGIWSVISGQGCIIEEPSNPVSTFTGVAGGVYALEWRISNSCGETSDEVTIIFESGAPFQCGGNFVDPRDGKIYTTVQIGTQCWMAENMNVGTRVDGVVTQTDNEVIEKYCYDNLEENCDQYGAFYQWNEAMQYSTEEGAQGICPDGWHFATRMEWHQMANFLDPTITNPNYQGWQGTNIANLLKQGGESGFEALYAGAREWDTGDFIYLNELGVFWTSSINVNNTIHSWFRRIDNGNPMLYNQGHHQAAGFSVRCLKDITTPPTWECGDPMIDERDGQTYNTVQIGEQCWMAENMNVGTKVDGVITQTNNGSIEKYCYDNLEENCDQYGAFYQWDEAMQYSTEEGVQGICPEGWHLATDLEWFQMSNFLDPTVTNPDLQSWQGTDIGIQLIQGGSSGFEALFSGYRHASSGSFVYFNEVSTFWTSTFNPYNPGDSWFRKLENGNPMIYKNGYNKSGGLSIRCVKGLNNPVWSCGDPIIDERDGQSYNTVQIGEQCWMAENLNIGNKIKGISDQTNNGVIEKYCYDNLEESCDQYGGLYQWDEMMQYTTVAGTQGICPQGWHLATDPEWFQMSNFLDPTVTNPDLQSWQGTDIGIQLIQGGSSGFEALFSGYRHASSGLFVYFNEVSTFWTSTFNPYNPDDSWFRKLENGNPMIYKNGYNKSGGLAVRCLLNN